MKRLIVPFHNRSSVSVKQRTKAFTITEVLVVIGLMTLLMTMVTPAVTGIRSSSDVTKAGYDISGMLEVARSYAMANNTYTFVGFLELDGMEPRNTASPKEGVGRVVVAVVASKDGTLGADPNSIGTSWASNYSAGANLTLVSKPAVFENLHLAETLGSMPTSGGMVRPQANNTEQLSSSSYRKSWTQFSLPLGSALNNGKQNFSKVISFTPRGMPVNYWKDNAGPGRYWEIALQNSKGNATPEAPKDQKVGNHLAILIHGMSGQTRVYRP